MKTTVLCLTASVVLTTAAEAAVWLPSLFSDGAVIQRDRPVPVWGRAAAGEAIEVHFGESTASSVADANGRWTVLLPPQPASRDGRVLTVRGRIDGHTSEVTAKDVLVGDVWLCTGQSNMEWPVRLSTGGPETAAAEPNPSIRHFKVPRTTTAAPREEMQADWKSATPEEALHFTGVGYFFARALHAGTGVPVGLVNCTYGGTSIECWMTPASLRASEAGRTALAAWEESRRDFETAVLLYENALASAPGEAQAHKPSPPAEYRAPSGVYDGMLYSIIPYAARGVLWYQGESNVGRAADYRILFPEMIQAWRRHWGTPELPFLFVQLPNWADANDRSGTAWAELRDAQTAALALPATGMVVAADLGEANDLHPREKRVLGERLAGLALQTVYGSGAHALSPAVSAVARKGGTVRIEFSPTTDGLALRPAGVDTGFELAGADGVFRPATARLEGSVAVVEAGDVPEPRQVRYAWRNNPAVTLYTTGGLPVVPFARTLP